MVWILRSKPLGCWSTFVQLASSGVMDYFPPVETARRLWTTVRVKATPKNPGPQGALMNL